MNSDESGPVLPLAAPARLVLGVATLVALACSLAQAVMLNGAPTAATGPAEISHWIQASGTAIRLAVLAGTLGTVALGMMTALLAGTLPQPFRLTYILGSLGILTTAMIQSWLWAALSRAPEGLSPDVLKLVTLVATQWGPTLTGFTTLAIAPIAWLGLRCEVGIPRWLGILAAVTAIEQLIEMITIFGEDGFLAPGGAMNMQLGAGLVTLSLFALAALRIRAR